MSQLTLETEVRLDALERFVLMAFDTIAARGVDVGADMRQVLEAITPPPVTDQYEALVDARLRALAKQLT